MWRFLWGVSVILRRGLGVNKSISLTTSPPSAVFVAFSAGNGFWICFTRLVALIHLLCDLTRLRSVGNWVCNMEIALSSFSLLISYFLK